MVTMPRDLKFAPSSGTGGFELAGAAIAVVVLLVGLAILTLPAIASPAVQTFGPGKVSCESLDGTQMDCLLAASWITQGNRNVATFSLASLPRGEHAFRP